MIHKVYINKSLEANQQIAASKHIWMQKIVINGKQKMKNGTQKMENEKWKKELGSYGGNAVVKTILAKRKRNLRVMDPFVQETIGRNMVSDFLLRNSTF